MGGDGQGDDFRLLANDAAIAHRAGQAGNTRRVVAAGLQAAGKTGTFGGRAYQTEKAEVVAIEPGPDQVEIERMAVSGDEHGSIGGQEISL